MLSEVNPVQCAVNSPAEQARYWCNINVKKAGFSEEINAINNCVSAQKKSLLVRDYSFVNFTPHNINNHTTSNEFSILNSIDYRTCFALVRDAYDVWISRECPPKFSNFYLNYVRNLKALNIPIFKYETLCAKPKETLAEIFDLLSLEFEPNCLIRFTQNTKFTGDKNSRGSSASSISQFKRKRLPAFLVKRICADKQAQEANELLGYSTNFLEPKNGFEPTSQIKVELTWKLKQWRGLYPREIY